MILPDSWRTDMVERGRRLGLSDVTQHGRSGLDAQCESVAAEGFQGMNVELLL